LFAFALFYIILGGRFPYVQAFVKATYPAAIYCMLYVYVFAMRREEKKKRADESRDEIVLNLEFNDKTRADMVIFGVPIIILVIAYLMKGGLEIDDIVQSAAALAALYYWHRYLFEKED
jgi:uncharacterized membrane protein YobD (UPF0266 family)